LNYRTERKKNMSRQELVTRIRDNGLVAVLRAESAEKAYRIFDACIEGGVAAIEITFTVFIIFSS
jgi:2-dehydro-3-deoxyphosphogluconate aldolase/(4S)-4-hydroxy-2-oxoglutarate aldolase